MKSHFNLKLHFNFNLMYSFKKLETASGNDIY